MSKFQVGDKVKQSAQSNYRWNTASNPVDVVGTIIEIREPGSVLFEYRVQWPKDRTNVYNGSDLELVEQVELVVVELKADVFANVKRLQELREQQSALGSEIVELADLIRKTLEGTGLALVEDIVNPVVTLQTLVSQDKVEAGDQFMCQFTHDAGEHIVGKVYAVVDLDRGDTMPVKLQSEDGEGWWIDEDYLSDYTKVN